uniref:Uncharacterized protein n=1 Tax=Panagrellus redivivus TaxID=6233 RepID=A0A7E4UYI3_PANRE
MTHPHAHPCPFNYLRASFAHLRTAMQSSADRSIHPFRDTVPDNDNDGSTPTVPCNIPGPLPPLCSLPERRRGEHCVSQFRHLSPSSFLSMLGIDSIRLSAGALTFRVLHVGDGLNSLFWVEFFILLQGVDGSCFKTAKMGLIVR